MVTALIIRVCLAGECRPAWQPHIVSDVFPPVGFSVQLHGFWIDCTIPTSILPFSHAPTQSGLNPGRRTRVEPGLSVSVSHGNLYHCVRIAIIDEKMAFGVWFFRVIVLLSILWLRRRHAARRRSLLACDMAWRARIRRRRAARARRRLLLYESMSRQLSTAYLQRRTVWVRHRSRSFWYEIAGNWSEREWKQN